VGGYGFLAACLVVPFLWGTLVVRVVRRADEAKRRFTPPAKPKTDYSI
jgi:hypothetical protein